MHALDAAAKRRWKVDQFNLMTWRGRLCESNPLPFIAKGSASMRDRVRSKSRDRRYCHAKEKEPLITQTN